MLRLIRTRVVIQQYRSFSSSQTTPAFEYGTLKVTRPQDKVYLVQLNRPEKGNSLNDQAWKDLRACFEQLSHEKTCRAIVLSALGKHFCTGIDLRDFSSLFSEPFSDPARRALHYRKLILSYQQSISAVENCPKPVIAAVHGYCIGAGVDLISACDIRYSTEEDAAFSIKEVDIGLAADVGTLQRFPKIVGNDSLARELCLTGRVFTGKEAKDMGFVSKVLAGKEALEQEALRVAVEISTKSPVAVQGTKINLNYSRDHTVEEGLQYVMNWNMSMLQSSDLQRLLEAAALKKKPSEFEDI
eukprot:TRINITY_DN11326_c0_g1_i1.p1 TRINITY_DN11326_c0_g1~~TRINITY_DN11326_c0_g1_i1.p1  ORF type:complete len:317 (-),score=71.33 TRINITY_DN11326_c0_g1_i1:13-912(-)